MEKRIYYESIKLAIYNLNPMVQLRNPVMFVVYLGALFATCSITAEAIHNSLSWFHIQIAVWMWFTVLFANFSQSFAESRGKAQTAALRKIQVEVQARVFSKGNLYHHLMKNGHLDSAKDPGFNDRKRPNIKSIWGRLRSLNRGDFRASPNVHFSLDGGIVSMPASELKKGMIIECKPGDIIPADGEIIEGIATIDESAITGESAPVIRESGGDRSAVTAGTQVVSDHIQIRITSEPGNTFLDRIIHLVEGAKRQKTPNEIALNIVLSTLTLIFLLTTASLKLFADFAAQEGGQIVSEVITVPVLIALLVCLIPTTVSALLNAIGIAGMDRLIRLNVIAKSGSSVEAAGDVDLLLLDKTGTITLGNRIAVNFIPISSYSEKELAKVAQMASLSDETPEGRSIVILAKNQFGLRAEEIDMTRLKFIPFSAQAAMSGVDFTDEKGMAERSIRKGSVKAMIAYIEKQGGVIPLGLEKKTETISQQGGTPLLVSDGLKIVGIISLKDVVKGGIRSRFEQLRKMGIKTVMVTGDNPITAAAIAAEAGVDDFIALATPEMKFDRIKQEQHLGHLVAMAGDGTNDAPALAQADVGVAMNTGTQPSREAGNMVDLDSNPTKLIEIIKIGKQLLMTRGALTTFSLTNDIAKYFAIIPAIFATLYIREGDVQGPLAFLNVMHLNSPQSAILSAVIFNALIIIALIPLALRGVRYSVQTTQELLLRHVLIYGVGGAVAPFIGIKAIDVLIHWMGFAA